MPDFSTLGVSGFTGGGQYLESFATAYKDSIEKNGIIPQTIPPTYPFNYLSWRDLAAYIEAALFSDQPTGKLYRIGGLEGIDGNSLAERLGSVLARSFVTCRLRMNSSQAF